MWPRTTISADRGGIAAGRDAIVGIPPEQLPAIIASATDPLKKITDEQQAIIGELQKRLGANESQLQTFFHIIGEAGVAPEQVGERLVEIASRYQGAADSGRGPPEDEPEVVRRKAEAREALETGDLDQADALLAEVEQLQEAALDRLALEAAATRVQRGEIALTRLRYREAAAHFAAAAGTGAAGAGGAERSTTSISEADALYRQGEEFGDNAALVEAIARYRALLDRRPRERVPLQWADDPEQPGQRAYGRWGSGRADTARLDEAVAAYREALEEKTRERVPLQWAATQNNLGNALTRLGERESGTARLDEAVAAYRAGPQGVDPRARPAPVGDDPEQPGHSRFATLGERESGTARLEEAVAAYREALKEWTRERVPLQWATTQNNLGLALTTLGERESGTARLDEAVAAYREALKEWTRERVPLAVGHDPEQPGHRAYERWGERESGTARLDEAVAAYRAALEERTRERVPLDWAMTQNNLGNALARLGERESGTARLEEAVAAYREALKERTHERVPLQWAATQNNLGNALPTLGERESGTARLDEAVAAYRDALKERTRERVPLDWAMTQNNLGIALAMLGERTGDGLKLKEAREAIAAAFEVYHAGRPGAPPRRFREAPARNRPQDRRSEATSGCMTRAILTRRPLFLSRPARPEGPDGCPRAAPKSPENVRPATPPGEKGWRRRAARGRARRTAAGRGFRKRRPCARPPR